MKITQVTRSRIVDDILLDQRSFHGRMDLMSFLKRVWDLSSMPSTDSRFSDADGDIWQHMVNNNDWSTEQLLTERLDILEQDDSVFLRFLEVMLHPLAVKSEEEARELASRYNKYLQVDGYRLVVSSRISGQPIYSAVDATTSAPIDEVYELVLSFAGEDRAYVEQVAEYLKAKDVRCFYDRYEEHTLWGKDLAEHLQHVYRSARYCVMFMSHYYAEKVWTTHEKRSALERAVKEKKEYILPARFDDTEIPGVSSNLCYIDLRKRAPQELGELLLKKLGRR